MLLVFVVLVVVAGFRRGRSGTTTSARPILDIRVDDALEPLFGGTLPSPGRRAHTPTSFTTRLGIRLNELSAADVDAAIG